MEDSNEDKKSRKFPRIHQLLLKIYPELGLYSKTPQ